jgi:predicted dehydrogenase
MFNIGVVGCGYWGPNLIRNFHQIPDTRVVCACDLNENRLSHMKRLYPHLGLYTDYQGLLEENGLDVIAIATPVHTHYDFAKKALKADKHVLVEKPLTYTSQQAAKLIELANKNNKVLMVDHTFEYVAAVNEIKKIIQRGELGTIYYINTSRLNLGLFQKDINVIWDLAPHDLSILMYVLDKRPLKISAHGNAYVLPGIEDVAVLSLKFPDNITTFSHLSWLDPCKVRQVTVVGSEKMLVYNDVEPLEKIRIYDQKVKAPKYYDTFGEFQFAYHYGDVVIPRIENTEPLKTLCSHFIECIKDNKEPVSNGLDGWRVIKVMEAAQKSLKNSGQEIEIEW